MVSLCLKCFVREFVPHRRSKSTRSKVGMKKNHWIRIVYRKYSRFQILLLSQNERPPTS